MRLYLLSAIFVMLSTLSAVGTVRTDESVAQYSVNRRPLHSRPYLDLPLGSIAPRGWLLETLRRQRNGMSRQMDTLYPEVMGERNGWLGGDGDQWERGPYWIDGLLPLAYILNDRELKDKVQPWIEWTLASQREDGFFGPSKDYPPQKGLQRNNSHDWWPRMVMLKVMMQYYSATSDSRVIDFLTRYFDYQLRTLVKTPLGNWTNWAEYRMADNLQVVYWLYNITGQEQLLELGTLLRRQGIDYIDMFLNSDNMATTASIHGVNLAQGLKMPVVCWQQDSNPDYLEAVDKAMRTIRKHNGFANGMFGGDEFLHGNNPTQGSELCSAVELMYSYELMAKITGNLEFVEQLERVAFNALPAQISDDFMTRQYFQQANQVLVKRGQYNFDINHGKTDLVFGLLTGYPCCTANLHQAWPKFVQNLWYATDDGGLAALVYSPCEVEAKVAGGATVRIVEKTCYPMSNKILFSIEIADNQRWAKFPFKLRIPSWSNNATISINGREFKGSTESGTVAVLDRKWQNGDVVELTMPMHINISEWYERSVAVERGPLVYGLRIEEEWVECQIEEQGSIYGQTYYEVYPKSKWNYGLLNVDPQSADNSFEVIEHPDKASRDWFWNLESAPIEIKAKAREIPFWTLYNNMAGPQPYSHMTYGFFNLDCPVQTVTLIPYGCTTLRISEFPLTD